jgi:energy-coupling factor transport system permease protein
VSIRISFAPRSSTVHRLDPRTKIFVWVAVAVPALATNSIRVCLAMFSITVVLSLAGKVSSRYVKNLTKVIVPVFIPIFLIQGLFNPVGKTPVLFILPWLSFKREGLVFAAVLLARLLAVFGGGYLLILTTHPGDLMASMQKLGLPLRIAYPLFSTFQIVPTIESRLQSVKQAQMSRGLKLENISVLQRLRAYVPLITPVLMGAIEEAYRRSIALEARGFSSKTKKTYLREVRLRRFDYCFAAVTVLVVIFLSSAIMTVVPRVGPWGV